MSSHNRNTKHANSSSSAHSRKSTKVTFLPVPMLEELYPPSKQNPRELFIILDGATNPAQIDECHQSSIQKLGLSNPCGTDDIDRATIVDFLRVGPLRSPTLLWYRFEGTEKQHPSHSCKDMECVGHDTEKEAQKARRSMRKGSGYMCNTNETWNSQRFTHWELQLKEEKSKHGSKSAKTRQSQSPTPDVGLKGAVLEYVSERNDALGDEYVSQRFVERGRSPRRRSDRYDYFDPSDIAKSEKLIEQEIEQGLIIARPRLAEGLGQSYPTYSGIAEIYHHPSERDMFCRGHQSRIYASINPADTRSETRLFDARCNSGFGHHFESSLWYALAASYSNEIEERLQNRITSHLSFKESEIGYLAAKISPTLPKYMEKYVQDIGAEFAEPSNTEPCDPEGVHHDYPISPLPPNHNYGNIGNEVTEDHYSYGC